MLRSATWSMLVVLTCVPLFAAIMRIPFSIIAPIILVFCAIGAYTVHNSTFDVVMMLVFGVVGYVLKKCNYPLAPMVLAIVLGDKAEEAFRQSLLSSQGSLGIFFSNALVSSIMALGLIALFWPMIQNAFTRLKTRPAMCPSHGRYPGRCPLRLLRKTSMRRIGGRQLCGILYTSHDPQRP